MIVRLRGRLAFALLPVLAAYGLVIGAAPAAHAATSYTWVGTSTGASGSDDHDWQNPANWVPAGVPGDGDSVVVAPPSATDCAAQVDDLPAVTLASLDLHEIRSAGVTCPASLAGGPLKVTGTFLFTGGKLAASLSLPGSAVASVRSAGLFTDVFVRAVSLDGVMTLGEQTEDGAVVVRVGPRPFTVGPTGVLQVTRDDAIIATGSNRTSAALINTGTIDTLQSSDQFDSLTVDGLAFAQEGLLRGRLNTVDATTASANGSARYEAPQGTATIWDAGDLTMTGTQTIPTSTVVSWNGALYGDVTFASTGGQAVCDGSIQGNVTIAPSAPFAIGLGAPGCRLAAADPSGAPISLVNHGGITLDYNETFDLDPSAVLTNAADGTILIYSGSSIAGTDCCADPATLANSGKLLYAGITHAYNGYLSDLSYQAAPGSTTAVQFNHRVLHLTGGARGSFTDAAVTGTRNAELSIESPTTVSGTITTGANMVLDLAHQGSLDGTATIIGNAPIDWSRGSMSGQLSITTTGGLHLHGTESKILRGAGSTLTVDAPFTLDAGTPTAAVVFDVENTSLVLQSTSTLGANSAITGGTVTNNGTLSPGGTDPATVTVGDTYTQAPTGTLALDIGPTTHDVVNTGTATLNGTVVVTNLAAPAIGAQAKVILSTGPLHWAVSCLITTGPGSTGPDATHWRALISAHHIVLEAVAGQRASC